MRVCNLIKEIMCMEMQEAEAAEKANPPMIVTCQAIVKAVIGVGVEEEDRKITWKADAEVTQHAAATPCLSVLSTTFCSNSRESLQ